MRTDALAFYRPGMRLVRRAVGHRPERLLPGAKVASAELLPPAALPAIRRLFDLRIMDLHDHPVHQVDGFQLAMDPLERRRLNRLTTGNIEAFGKVVVISQTFADLCEVAEVKRVLIPNGTDTTHVTVHPSPNEPIIAMVSGAAPGRGIELLIDAVALVREVIPEAELRLGLAAPNAPTRSYLDGLRRTISNRPWATIRHAPYAGLSNFLAEARVLAIPHVDNAYMNSALPVKLFDSMAAGRPVVVTPRLETAAIVRRYEAGIVAGSDAPEDLATALLTSLTDENMAQRLGANGRRAAVEVFDWRILGARFAAAALA